MEKTRKLTYDPSTNEVYKRDLGRVATLWKGDWDSNERYDEMDEVRHNGAKWICLEDCMNVEPGTNPRYWAPQLYDGTQGLQGMEGPEGPRGVQGLQGLKGEDASMIGPQGLQGLQGPDGPQGTQGLQGNTGTQGKTGNQGPEGPQGIEGPQGVQGEKGVQGPTGADGQQGPRGQKGDRGQEGPMGAQGYTGAQGLRGDVGNDGPQGPRGNQGHEGAQGFKGNQGLQGIQGETGSHGLQGLQGETGAQGFKGNQGLQGIQGETGAQGADGTQGYEGQQGIQGETGAQGADGTQGYEGQQGLQGETGAQGIQGVQGETGSQGADGAQGYTGNQGLQGTTGDHANVVELTQSEYDQITPDPDVLYIITDAQGPQGLQGITGSQGIQGETGAQGADGNNGSQGADGAQGYTGNQGYTGAQGLQGLQGADGQGGGGDIPEDLPNTYVIYSSIETTMTTGWGTFKDAYLKGEHVILGVNNTNIYKGRNVVCQNEHLGHSYFPNTSGEIWVHLPAYVNGEVNTPIRDVSGGLDVNVVLPAGTNYTPNHGNGFVGTVWNSTNSWWGEDIFEGGRADIVFFDVPFYSGTWRSDHNAGDTIGPNFYVPKSRYNEWAAKLQTNFPSFYQDVLAKTIQYDFVVQQDYRMKVITLPSA